MAVHTYINLYVFMELQSSSFLVTEINFILIISKVLVICIFLFFLVSNALLTIHAQRNA